MFNCIILRHNKDVIGVFKSIEMAEYTRDLWKQVPAMDQNNWFCDWAYIANLPF